MISFWKGFRQHGAAGLVLVLLCVLTVMVFAILPNT